MSRTGIRDPARPFRLRQIHDASPPSPGSTGRDEGRIIVGGKTYFDGARGAYLPPERASCGLVFQSYALWPHMTVFDNVVFPLTLRKVNAAERKRRAWPRCWRWWRWRRFADRYPHMLSGGQQQRVALARTLVYQPAILLLDEPLSNLDAKLRDRARVWLAELRTRLGLATTIYVTHDQIEALSLSDRIVVMNGGRIAQLGTPQDIYERPADPFVADFIGTTNFLPAKVAEPGAGTGCSSSARRTADRSGGGTCPDPGRPRPPSPSGPSRCASRPPAR